MSSYVFELTDVSIANGSDTLQINNSDSVFGAIPGSMLWIDSYRPRFVQSVDNTARTVTLTANWDGSDVNNKPAVIAPFPSLEEQQKTVDAVNKVTINGELLLNRFLGLEGQYVSFINSKFDSIQSLVQGRVSKPTLAALHSDLDHPEDTLAEVWDDPTRDNNGLYGKQGASGTGSWKRSEYDTLLTIEKSENLANDISSINRLIYRELLESSVSETYAWGVADRNNRLALAIDKDGKTHLELTDSYKKTIAENAFEQVNSRGNYVWGVVDSRSRLALGVDENGLTTLQLSDATFSEISKNVIDSISLTEKIDIAALAFDRFPDANFLWGVVDSANKIAFGIDKNGKSHLDLLEGYKAHVASYAYDDVGDAEDYVWGVVDSKSSLALGVNKDGFVYANLSVNYKEAIASYAYTYIDSIEWSWGIIDEANNIALGLGLDGKLTFSPSEQAARNIESVIYGDGGTFPRYVWGVVDDNGRLAVALDRKGLLHTNLAGEIKTSDLIDGDFSWGVVDEEGKIALGIKKNGKVFLQLDDSVSSALSTVDVNSLNGPGNAYMGISSSATTVDYLADGEGVVRGYRQRSDINSQTAMFNAKGPIFYLGSTGQSLNVGGGASENTPGTEVFTTSPVNPHYAFMFDTGTRGAMWSTFSPYSVTDLVPAFEQFNGTNQAETQGSGMMRALHNYNESNNLLLRTYLYRAHGAGGATIQDLQKDSGYPMFANGLAECVKAQELAALYNREFIMPAFTFTQGEQNRSTDFATYYGLLDTLINDYQSEYAAILPQSNPTLVCIIDQLAASTSGSPSDVPLAHLAMAKDRADTYISTPKYMFEYSGPVHLVPKYYSILGEYQARVWRTLFIDEQSWAPVWPISVSRVDDVIDIQCHVPTPPLVIDTTTLPLAPDYGFTYSDDSGSPPGILSVEVVGADTIRITLDSIPTGNSKTIEYANRGPGASGRAGAWGNIHDSETEVSQTDPGFTLYNWLVIFKEEIN